MRAEQTSRAAGAELSTLRRAAPCWKLEFECDGAPFYWTGQAFNQHDAEGVARADLSIEHAAFVPTNARLVACHQA